MRDAVLGILGRPLLPSQIVARGCEIGALLANVTRTRKSWHEEAAPVLAELG